MFKLKILLCFVLVFTFYGCAPSIVYIKPVKSEQQVSIFQDGTETLVSKKKSIVAVRPLKENYLSTERLSFAVTVYNATKAPINFSTENIQLTANKKKIKVFSYQELINEIEQRRRQAALSSALLGISQIIAVGSNPQYSGSFQSKKTGYGTYSGTVYNPATTIQTQLAVNSQTKQDIKFINDSAQSSLQKVKNTMLKKETVSPRTWYGGYIRTEPLQSENMSGDILLIVNLATDVHQFNISFSPNELELIKKYQEPVSAQVDEHPTEEPVTIESLPEKAPETKISKAEIENNREFQAHCKTIIDFKVWLTQTPDSLLTNHLFWEKTGQKMFINAASAHNDRGLIYENQNMLEKAIEDFSTCVTLYPNSSSCYYNRGRVHRKLDKLEDSLNDYSKIIEIEPNNANYYRERGHVYNRLKLYKEGLADILKSLELDPNNPKTYVTLGIHYLSDVPRIPEAKDAFTKAIEIDPFFKLAYYERGITNFYYNNDYAGAITDLTTTIKLDPTWPKPYFIRGLAYTKINNHHMAIKDFSKAIEFSPTNAAAYYERFLCFGEINNIDKALSDCRIAASLGNAKASSFLDRYERERLRIESR